MHLPSGKPLAGVGRRFGALLIDYVAIFMTCVFLVIAVSLFADAATQGLDDDRMGALWAILFVFGWGVALFFYHWLCLMLGGRSIGKLLTGIKVVRAADGGPVTQGQAIVRSAIFVLPHTAFLFAFGFFFVLVDCLAANSDADQRALHDRAARTVVILG